MRRRHGLCPAVLAVLAAVLCLPAAAYADAGLPMLPVAYPKLLLYLAAAIAVEAAYLHSELHASWRRTILAVAGANLITTALGYPLAWGLYKMIHLDLPMLPNPTDILSQPAAMVGWISGQLYPSWDGAQRLWPEQGVFVVLLIPGYLLSGLVKVWFLDSYDLLHRRGDARTVVWHANRLSYLLLAVVGCLLLYRASQPQ
jgi:hypothetical protein